MSTNWEMGLMPNIGMNALAAFQQGRQIRQQQDERQAKLLEAQRQQQIEMQERQLVGDALANPDPAIRSAARQKVAYFNSDLYQELGEGERKQLDDFMGVIAQQAFPILQLPPEQHEQGLQAALSNLKQRGYPVEQFKRTGDATADLKTALAIAGQLDDFEKFQQPNYIAVGKDQDMVNTRDPAAVAQFARGAGGNIPSPKSKAERDALPAGAKYYDPEGNLRTKAGGPTPAASGGFPGQ